MTKFKILLSILPKLSSSDSKEGNSSFFVILLSAVFVVILLCSIVPSVILTYTTSDGVTPLDVNKDTYIKVAEIINIPSEYLFNYDSVQYDNNFDNVTVEDLFDTVFIFCQIEVYRYSIDIWKYETTTRGNSPSWQHDERENRNGVIKYKKYVKVLEEQRTISKVSEFKSFFNIDGDLTVDKFNNFIAQAIEDGNLKGIELKYKAEVVNVDTTYISFEQAINNFDEDKREYALDILHSGIFESELFDNNYADVVDLANLVEYDEGSEFLPYYNQSDARWALSSYGSSQIYGAGCGPTALAMVVAGLKGTSITPLDVTNWSVANGHRAEGSGSYWSLITSGGSHYGLTVTAVGRNNTHAIRSALEQGYPLIAIMGPGTFTKTGHFIVLLKSENGLIKVYDPASLNRTNQLWDLSLIQSQASTKGNNPFWILKP